MEVNRRSISISPEICLLQRDFGNKPFPPVYSDDNCHRTSFNHGVQWQSAVYLIVL